MKNTIISKLAEIEKREGFEILYACESGSRAWGFASDDSDYDVRFVYLRQCEQYLHLKPLRDVCEAELNDIYDINGWDLKKFFTLLLKSNPAIFEWASSPIVYKTSDKWNKIERILNYYLDTKTLLYHYLSMVKNQVRMYLQDEQVRYKKYLYALRPLLACRFIFKENSRIPMDFKKLCAAVLPSDMRECVDKLLFIKHNNSEKQSGEHIKSIDDFINNEICAISELLEKHPKGKKPDESVLDELFVELLGTKEF